MPDLSKDGWACAYRRLAEDLRAMAADAPITLCGMSACVDARTELHQLEAFFATTDPDAAAFAGLLRDRARQGIGGEVRVDWPGGPAWLAKNVAFTYALGGTGPQTAWVLSTLGAPALLALEDRSAHMLANLPAGLLVFQGTNVVPAALVAPHGERRPDIYIFDYTQGIPVGGVVPPRSSRIIVRFNDPGLEHDASFDRSTPDLARAAGAGLISGFNCVPSAELSTEIERVFALGANWRRSGLDVLHLELAGYDSIASLERVLQGAAHVVTSLGMSHSEFAALMSEGASLANDMVELGERLGVMRVCVHADEWAASVTLGDPVTERQALMAGSLLAAARAEVGRPVRPHDVPKAATFTDPPYRNGPVEGPWSFVCCATPYLSRPATTLGLGDTFTAGCLLVLGLDRRRGQELDGSLPYQAAASPIETNKPRRNS